MGSGTSFRGNNLVEQRWEQVGYADGIKIIRMAGLENSASGALPLFSNTSRAYALAGTDKRIIQIRTYNHTGQKNSPELDIDIMPNKPHGNPDGSIVPKGIVHYHEWIVGAKGSLERSRWGYKIPKGERWDKLKAIIRKINPDAKFE